MIKCFFIELNPLIIDMSYVRCKAWSYLKQYQQTMGLDDEKFKYISDKHSTFKYNDADILACKEVSKLTNNKKKEIADLYSKFYINSIKEIKSDQMTIGMHELLEDIKKREIKIILFTYEEKNIDQILKKLKIVDLIDEIVILDENSHITKEDFLDQIIHYSFLPNECIYVSQSNKKIIEANKAQLFTVAIGTESFEISKPNLIFEYIDSVKFENIAYSFYSKNKNCEDEEM